jgi:RNA polymerase sigma-70 factor, ECF subfamily
MAKFLFGDNEVGVHLGVSIQFSSVALNPGQGQEPADRLALLLAAYQRGERGGANQFAEAVQPILFRYFYVRTPDRTLAEDLSQECWMRIHSARASFRTGDPVLPWVFAIARHTRADHYRRAGASKRRAPESMEEPSVDARPAMERTLEAGRVMERLGELPEAQREVFLLLKVHGLSVDEAACAVGISPAAAKQKAYRAYEQLRAMFGRAKEDATK